jgi:hypothetical protein
MWEPGQRSSRDGAALLGALLFHAAALVVISRVARPLVSAVVAPVSSSARLLDAVDVDLLADPSDVPVSLTGEGSESLAAARNTVGSATHEGVRAAGVRVASLGRAAGAPTAALELSEEGRPAGGPVEVPAAIASGAEAARPVDLGLGPNAWTRWLATDREDVPPPEQPAKHAPVVRAAPASSTGGLVEGLAEADRQRLVGPSGRVVNALEGAAHGDGAAAFGAARFAVTVLRTGGVEVTLESASSGEAEWRRVAERAAEDLRANAPKIRPPSEGERFFVELSAEMQLPNGVRASTLYGPRIEATPPRIQGWEAGKKDMLLKNPTAASGLSRTDQMHANVELPGVYLAQKGSVCSYRFGLSVLGPLLQGGCDPSNLGAKPQRVVHAHVTRQELF